MCDRHGPETSAAPAVVRKRLRIWEITGGLQCSIIGTCLTHEDLLKIGERCGIRIAAGTSAYDVHSYFVNETSFETPSARGVTKLLDQRYEGIVRKVGRCTTAKCLDALWTTEYEAGRVPGAYWAFFSHASVSDELRHRIFGDVHMLSHVLGKSTHQVAARATDYAGKAAELEERLARQRQQQADALASRDARIAALEQTLVQSQAGAAARAVEAPQREGARTAALRLTARRDRAILVARERARRAEAETLELQQRVRRLEMLNRSLAAETLSPRSAECPGAAACDDLIAAGEIRRILYLGGRTGAVDQLRLIAERANTDFIHHDGGLEQGVARIDPLVEGCDAVFCPIDCISHSACQRAKALCRKLGKTFVPLRSSGASTFERALASLRA